MVIYKTQNSENGNLNFEVFCLTFANCSRLTAVKAETASFSIFNTFMINSMNTVAKSHSLNLYSPIFKYVLQQPISTTRIFWLSPSQHNFIKVSLCYLCELQLTEAVTTHPMVNCTFRNRK